MRALLATILLTSLGTRPLHAAPLAPRVKSSPSPIVLGQSTEAVIEVTDLPGAGPVAAGVNVGEVKALEVFDDRVRIAYRLPEQHYPQRLCLLLVRTRELDPRRRVHVARLPLLARTRVPVSTRRNAQVTLQIGGRTFGPRASGPTGRLTLDVLVPPGVSEGEAVAIGEKGLETRRRVEIRQKPYNALAVVAAPTRVRPGERIAVAVAASDPLAAPPALEIEAEWASQRREAPAPIPLAVAADHWTASLAPGPHRSVIRTTAPGSGAQVTVEVVEAPSVATADAPRLHARVSHADEGAAPRKLRFSLSLAAGFLHNTGALFSPRLTAELGAEVPVGRGRIGGRLLVSTSWSSQEVPIDAPASGHSAASARVVIAPIGVLASYRIPLRRLSPYAAAGVIAQIVSTRSSGEATGEQRRVDLAIGALALLGAGVELGRGQLFLQAGYQHCRIENDAVAILAGGLLAEVGYRLELGR